MVYSTLRLRIMRDNNSPVTDMYSLHQRELYVCKSIIIGKRKLARNAILIKMYAKCMLKTWIINNLDENVIGVRGLYEMI